MPQSAEDILEKVKASLRKKHPKWDNKQISSSANAIVQEMSKEK